MVDDIDEISSTAGGDNSNDGEEATRQTSDVRWLDKALAKVWIWFSVLFIAPILITLLPTIIYIGMFKDPEWTRAIDNNPGLRRLFMQLKRRLDWQLTGFKHALILLLESFTAGSLLATGHPIFAAIAILLTMPLTELVPFVDYLQSLTSLTIRHTSNRAEYNEDPNSDKNRLKNHDTLNHCNKLVAKTNRIAIPFVVSNTILLTIVALASLTALVSQLIPPLPESVAYSYVAGGCMFVAIGLRLIFSALHSRKYWEYLRNCEQLNIRKIRGSNNNTTNEERYSEEEQLQQTIKCKRQRYTETLLNGFIELYNSCSNAYVSARNISHQAASLNTYRHLLSILHHRGDAGDNDNTPGEIVGDIIIHASNNSGTNIPNKINLSSYKEIQRDEARLNIFKQNPDPSDNFNEEDALKLQASILTRKIQWVESSRQEFYNREKNRHLHRLNEENIRKLLQQYFPVGKTISALSLDTDIELLKSIPENYDQNTVIIPIRIADSTDSEPHMEALLSIPVNTNNRQILYLDLLYNIEFSDEMQTTLQMTSITPERNIEPKWNMNYLLIKVVEYIHAQLTNLPSLNYDDFNTWLKDLQQNISTELLDINDDSLLTKTQQMLDQILIPNRSPEQQISTPSKLSLTQTINFTQKEDADELESSNNESEQNIGNGATIAPSENTQ